MQNQSPEEAKLEKSILLNIRNIQDWPMPGVQFRDITPLLNKASVFQSVIQAFASHYRPYQLTKIVGIEARGFIIGSALAMALGIGFIPIRKKGKLPFSKLSESYFLEYGEAQVEIHTDACSIEDRVIIVDDLIATGGSMLASIKLIERLKAKVVEAAAIIQLSDLDGINQLRKANIPVYTLCSLDSR